MQRLRQRALFEAPVWARPQMPGAEETRGRIPIHEHDEREQEGPSRHAPQFHGVLMVGFRPPQCSLEHSGFCRNQPGEVEQCDFADPSEVKGRGTSEQFWRQVGGAVRSVPGKILLGQIFDRTRGEGS